tara:strand:- start:99 stop:365 length:267 start_codon:yes stop_codon:yes gene_type:complete
VKKSKKVFISSSSDRGVFVKFLKGKVSLSFWGNDDPKNISYSEKEIRELCEYILTEIGREAVSERSEEGMFNEVCKEMISRIPPKQKL